MQDLRDISKASSILDDELAHRSRAGVFPERSVQDLKRFRLPKHFREKPAWFVQLWWIVQSTLFRMSPQVFYGWRRFLLRLFGCSVGRGVLIRPTAEITYPWNVTIGAFAWIGDQVTLYSLGQIHIAESVVISQKSYICTGSHDFSVPTFDIFAAPIVIEAESWLAADVFVAPGVQIGRGCVIGARSTVLHDTPAMMVCFGNPAKPVRPRGVFKQDSIHTAGGGQRK